MGPTPFYGARAEKTQKADFAMKQTNICRLSGDINDWTLSLSISLMVRVSELYNTTDKTTEV